jgi:hypothetical protein
MGIIFHKEVVKHIVTIIADGREFIVEPYAIQVKANDHIYFQNLTNEKIIILFPEIELFGKYETEIIDPGKYALLTVQSDKPDSYPYIVFVYGYDDFASKGAAPKIIVYDDFE